MRDIRYAFRSLSRSKGFAAIAVISLALALGLNTSMFAILDAFMHPFNPYRDADQLIRVGFSVYAPKANNETIRTRTSFHEEMGGYGMDEPFVSVGTDRRRAAVAYMTPNYMSMVGVKPEKGRILTSPDETVAVVSRAFWLNRLGAPASLEGVTVSVDGRTRSVVGVMPREMSYPIAFDVWVATDARPRFMSAVVRLKPGISLADASAEMERLATQLTDESRTPNGRVDGYKAFAVPLLPNPFQLNQFHLALAGCALLVLLIACANLANLMLARGVTRRRELALRMAIGASRGALIQQLVIEAGILVAGGAAIGVFFTLWGISLSQAELPALPELALPPVHLSGRLFMFALLASAVTVVLVGLFPALTASDVSLAEPLKSSSGTSTPGQSRFSLLAVVQVALALVLVMSATVLGKSAYRFINQDSDFSRTAAFAGKGLFTTGLNLRDQQLPDQVVGQRVHDVLDRIRTVPGVRFAATLSTHELSQGHVVLSDDERSDSTASMMLRAYSRVSADYLRAYSIGIREGRDFEPGDRDVAVINQGAAVRLWHNRSPIGRLLKLGPAHSRAAWIPVIGVFDDGKDDWHGAPDLAPTPIIYVIPAVDTARARSVVIRSDQTNDQVGSQAGREIQVALSLPAPPTVSERKERASYVGRMRGPKTLTSGIFSLVAFFGLALATVGLYGVLSHTVSVRLREFGVRMALGATKENVYRLVLHDGAVMFLAGTALGAFAAMYATQFIEHLLYEVEFTDAASLLISEVVLCTAALLACLAPARRATKSDPVEILRAT